MQRRCNSSALAMEYISLAQTTPSPIKIITKQVLGPSYSLSWLFSHPLWSSWDQLWSHNLAVQLFLWVHCKVKTTWEPNVVHYGAGFCFTKDFKHNSKLDLKLPFSLSKNKLYQSLQNLAFMLSRHGKKWGDMMTLAISIINTLELSFWPCDTIWRHRFGSTLAQVMAVCLTAPSHYLN